LKKFKDTDFSAPCQPGYKIVGNVASKDLKVQTKLEQGPALL
jgi:hypothetical protein